MHAYACDIQFVLFIVLILIGLLVFINLVFIFDVFLLVLVSDNLVCSVLVLFGTVFPIYPASQLTYPSIQEI